MDCAADFKDLHPVHFRMYQSSRDVVDSTGIF
jgi:hypothetical protein